MLAYHFPVSALQIPFKTLRIKFNKPRMQLFESKLDWISSHCWRPEIFPQMNFTQMHERLRLELLREDTAGDGQRLAFGQAKRIWAVASVKFSARTETTLSGCNGPNSGGAAINSRRLVALRASDGASIGERRCQRRSGCFARCCAFRAGDSPAFRHPVTPLQFAAAGKCSNRRTHARQALAADGNGLSQCACRQPMRHRWSH